MEILIFLIAGVCAGLLSGLFGLGGGVIVVPALVFSFDLIHSFPGNVMHVAEGTSLAIMVITTASSSFSHYRRGNVLFNLVGRLIAGIVMGVLLGAFTAHFLSSHVLRLIFAGFLVLVACRMFYTSYLIAHKFQQREPVMPSVFSSSLFSLLIGFVSGLLGTGAGSTTVPYLTQYHFKMKNIAATAASCSFPISIVGSITYLLLGLGKVNAPLVTGYIDWTAFLFVAIASLLCAPIGARLSTNLNSLLLKRIFTVILLLLAINMFYGALA